MGKFAFGSHLLLILGFLSFCYPQGPSAYVRVEAVGGCMGVWAVSTQHPVGCISGSRAVDAFVCGLQV